MVTKLLYLQIETVWSTSSVFWLLQLEESSPTIIKINHTSPSTRKTNTITFQFTPPAAASFCKVKVGSTARTTAHVSTYVECKTTAEPQSNLASPHRAPPLHPLTTPAVLMTTASSTTWWKVGNSLCTFAPATMCNDYRYDLISLFLL